MGTALLTLYHLAGCGCWLAQNRNLQGKGKTCHHTYLWLLVEAVVG